MQYLNKNTKIFRPSDLAAFSGLFYVSDIHVNPLASKQGKFYRFYNIYFQFYSTNLTELLFFS